MKKRKGFVSNSSSSSFIIELHYLSQYQIDAIQNHIEIAKKIDSDLLRDGKETKYEYYEDWFINVDDFALWAKTSMDNFDLETFIIDELGIPYDAIKYFGDGNWTEDINDDHEYKNYKTIKSRKNKILKLKNISKNE